ncbi:MAG: hypothetical protein WBA39_33785 [Rivularia sp. (in: cyanobacteria)]
MNGFKVSIPDFEFCSAAFAVCPGGQASCSLGSASEQDARTTDFSTVGMLPFQSPSSSFLE